MLHLEGSWQDTTALIRFSRCPKRAAWIGQCSTTIDSSLGALATSRRWPTRAATEDKASSHHWDVAQHANSQGVVLHITPRGKRNTLRACLGELNVAFPVDR